METIRRPMQRFTDIKRRSTMPLKLAAQPGSMERGRIPPQEQDVVLRAQSGATPASCIQAVLFLNGT